MARGQFTTVFRHLRQLLGSQPTAAPTDGQLLHRFVHEQEQAAFTLLVQRHGPMVLGLCRRTLQDEQAAEDVFQAVFLVLVRKARSLRQYGSLGNWLHTVAYHLALKSRTHQARRRSYELQVDAMPEPVARNDGGWSELRPVLDAELARLPDKYRAPVVLCYLEGKTNEDAARELGWPVGTVKVRLSRAREMLRDRLTRRGLAFTLPLLGPALAETASAAVPLPLLVSITEGAALFAAGRALAAGAGSDRAFLLAQGALKAMFLGKLQSVVAFCLLVGLLAAGTNALLSQSPTLCPVGGGQAKHPSTEPPPLPPLVIVAEEPKVELPRPEGLKVEVSKAETPQTPDLAKHLRTQLSRGKLTIEIPPNTPLGDALQEIAKAAKTPIVINRHAFEAIGVQKVEEQPVQLAKMTDAKLSTVLHRLLDQVQGDVYRGTFQVRNEHIEATTTYNVQAEAAASPSEHPALRDLDPEAQQVPREIWSDPTRRITCVIWVEVEQLPLSEALREIADTAGAFQVVIDRRVAAKASTAVSLSLNRVWFDTAVNLLVEQADLDWLWMDNLVYVTSKENAKLRREQLRVREEQRVRMLKDAVALKRHGFIPAPDPQGQVVQPMAQRPLDDVLRGIAWDTGLRVVIDARVGDKAKAPVKAEVHSMPAETAIKLLADMAELRAVLVDDVYYITSKENARALEAVPPKDGKAVKP